MLAVLSLSMAKRKKLTLEYVWPRLGFYMSSSIFFLYNLHEIIYLVCIRLQFQALIRIKIQMGMYVSVLPREMVH